MGYPEPCAAVDELWRRFNLFPPDYQTSSSLIDTLLPKAGRGAK
jgi:hypothetical protein